MRSSLSAILEVGEKYGKDTGQQAFLTVLDGSFKAYMTDAI